jgi:tetratricopeptide (TPR) repeat protein
VNGLNLKFIFDTGASDVSISMTEATFMLKNDYLSENDILGKSKYQDANGNISEGVNIVLKEIEIGGLKLYNVKASVVTNIKAPLLLGQTAISKLGVVQLDLEANTLTIFPRRDSLGILNGELGKDSLSKADANELNVKSKSELLLEEAFTYFDEREYQQAIGVFDKILRDEPKNVLAYFHRGLSYDFLEDYNTAIRDYTKVIELEPKHELAFSYRGKSKFDLKDYNGALMDLNKGLLNSPQNKLAYIWRAETKKELKNYNGAIQDYDKAISISPEDTSLYVRRAYVRNEIKDFKGAIIDCNKAINLNSHYAKAYFCRGVSKRKLKDYNGSIIDFDKVIEIDAEYAEAYVQRGEIKESVFEDLDGAMEDFERAIEIDNEYFYARLCKALLEEKIKKNVWVKVCNSAKGDVWYVYNSIVSKSSSTIKIWIKTEYKNLSVIKNGKTVVYPNGYKLSLCLFNCNDKEYRFLSAKNYDSKGSLINDYEFGDFENWETPAPETVIEIVQNKVCELYN